MSRNIGLYSHSSGNSNSATQTSTHPPTSTIMSAHLGSVLTDPVGNDTPAETSSAAMPNSEITAFAKAIHKIVNAIHSHPKPKLWELNPFDGSDSHKLCTFILQCKLN